MCYCLVFVVDIEALWHRGIVIDIALEPVTIVLIMTMFSCAITFVIMVICIFVRTLILSPYKKPCKGRTEPLYNPTNSMKPEQKARP